MYTFISYKREDEPRVARIVHALERSGVEVWWDRGLPGGESWHQMIEQKLEHASCVIIAWTHGSVGPDGNYVRDEGRRALERDILVPVLLDAVPAIPLGFGEAQAVDLTQWNGSASDPFFLDLLNAVRAKQEKAQPTASKGPQARIRRRFLIGSLSTTLAATAAAVAFGLNVSGVSAKVCSVGGLQPTLSDACGALNVGERPTKSQRLAWEALKPGSCEDLRAYITRFPNSASRGRAADLLAARTESVTPRWQSAKRELALYQSAVEPASSSEAAAHADALKRAKYGAEKLCRGFGAGTIFRYVSASAQAERWNCSAAGKGIVCGFEGRAVCEVEERQDVVVERCNSAVPAT